ncbi:MAG: hypothetical protein RBR77_04140 [Thauera sp.]|jgi:hypothetical protein|nr:hypothetical protein [Thauera sp.]
MKKDVLSNYQITEGVAAKSNAAGTVNGAAVDHANAISAGFFISAGTFGTDATLDAKLQYSDDGTTWTDYPADDPAGNVTRITQMTAAGSDALHVVQAYGRYSRAVLTVGTAAVTASVTNIAGPMRHVVAN